MLISLYENTKCFLSSYRILSSILKSILLILKNKNKKIEIFTLLFSCHFLQILKFLKKIVPDLLYKNTKSFLFLSQILRSILKSSHHQNKQNKKINKYLLN